MRIAVVLGHYPEAQGERRKELIRAYSDSITTVEPLDIDVSRYDVTPSGYAANITPTEISIAAHAFIDAFAIAERQGFDAVLPLGTLDFGVEGGKSAVDIPVIGPLESSLAVARTVGMRIGLLAYHDLYRGPIFHLVESYGHTEKIVGFETVGTEVENLASQTDLRARIVLSARNLVQMGADVIVPVGISLCPLHVSAGELSNQVGVPVVEGVGTPIQMAKAYVALGLKQSRTRWPRSSVTDIMRSHPEH